MVNLVVGVEALAGILAASRVWRINEEERIRIFSMLFDDIESVCMLEPDSTTHCLQGFNTFHQRLRIPARMQSSPGFTGLHQTSASSHDPAALHPVLDDGPKGVHPHGVRIAVKSGPYILKGHIESEDLIAQPRHTVLWNGLSRRTWATLVGVLPP